MFESRPLRTAASLLLVAVLLPAWPSRVAAVPPGTDVVNGVLTSQYPTTGALLYANGATATPTNASSWCTGTLIGCSTFLTAAHCVEDDLDPAAYQVFFQHAGFFSLASIEMHPSYPQADATGDIAIVKLSTPVTGIAPSPLGLDDPVPVSSVGTIVGFGQSGGSVGDYGLKRVGDVVTSSCSGISDDGTSICWEYTNPVGPPGDDSNTCNGDSGGPLFIDNGCGLDVVGATSYGFNANCTTPDDSVDASVVGHQTFIVTEGGADLSNATCGSISQAGDSNSTITAFNGTVSGGSSQATHSFSVAGGVTELRVAMNAIDDGADFDLYVREGAPPTTSTFDCAQTGGNQYGYCDFTSPAAGTWWVLVDRNTGSGTYQVTVTALGASVGVFPNDGNACSGDSCTSGATCSVQECSGGSAVPDGTACDDGSPCTPMDQCLSGACVGSETPRATCKAAPGRALLKILDRGNDAGDKLVFKMTRGPATTIGDYDDPRTGSPDHHICIYDRDSGQDVLKIDAEVPGGGLCKGGQDCWKPIGGATPKGYRYVDAVRTPAGVQKLILKEGEAGKAKIIATGRGPLLGLPGPHAAFEYFAQDGDVTAQLVQDDGDCWSVGFGSATRNDDGQFKAICGTPIAPCN